MLDNPKLTIMQFRSTLKDQIHSFIQSESRSVMSDCLQPHRLYSPWNSPGQNTGTGSLSLLQGIFPTHGLNPSLLYGRQILYQLNHKGSPRILEWVAYFFSSGSPQPRNRKGISCIPGRFFTNWAIREGVHSFKILIKPLLFAKHCSRCWDHFLLVLTFKSWFSFLHICLWVTEKCTSLQINYRRIIFRPT